MPLTIDRNASAHRPAAYDEHPPGWYGSSAGSALPLFLAAVVGLVVTAWIALYTATGQRYDETALSALSGAGTTINHRLVRLLEQVNTNSVVIALLVMIAVALVRRRFRLAVAAIVLVGGANLTTQVLKHYLLSRPKIGDETVDLHNTLPSGHTTMVFSLVLAAVLVSPRALRWLVAFVGSAVGGLTGLTTVIAGWHRPGDVVAAMLVTVAWAALVSGLLTGNPRDGIRGSGGGFSALLGGVVAAVGVIIYGFGWTTGPDASHIIPVTAAVIGCVAAVGVGAYASLVSRTSN